MGGRRVHTDSWGELLGFLWGYTLDLYRSLMDQVNLLRWTNLDKANHFWSDLNPLIICIDEHLNQANSS